MLDDQRFPYQVYILRLWRDGVQTPWRAALEHARTGERHAFAALADLYAFLDAETGTARAPTLENDHTEDGGNVKWKDGE